MWAGKKKDGEKGEKIRPQPGVKRGKRKGVPSLWMMGEKKAKKKGGNAGGGLLEGISLKGEFDRQKRTEETPGKGGLKHQKPGHVRGGKKKKRGDLQSRTGVEG